MREVEFYLAPFLFSSNLRPLWDKLSIYTTQVVYFECSTGDSLHCLVLSRIVSYSCRVLREMLNFEDVKNCKIY